MGRIFYWLRRNVFRSRSIRAKELTECLEIYVDQLDRLRELRIQKADQRDLDADQNYAYICVEEALIKKINEVTLGLEQLGLEVEFQ